MLATHMHSLIYNSCHLKPLHEAVRKRRRWRSTNEKYEYIAVYIAGSHLPNRTILGLLLRSWHCDGCLVARARRIGTVVKNVSAYRTAYVTYAVSHAITYNCEAGQQSQNVGDVTH